MKAMMLGLDFFIAAVFIGIHINQGSADFSRLVLLMVFFLVLRTLALSQNMWLSLANLLMLPLLWRYDPAWLILLYLGYSLIYFYLDRKEEFAQRLESENTRLLIETQNLQRYRLLQARYEEQLEANLRLDERRRIAQDIHDLLGHSIAAATLQLEAARSLIREEPEQAEAMLAQSTERLRGGMDQIRATVKAMHAQTDGVKLAQVKLLIDQFRRDSGLDIYWDIRGDHSQLQPAHWKMIYSTIGEGLSNVIRHAEATSVAIELHVLPQLFRLSIRDDGRGAADMVEGLGLFGIRERVEELGGRLTLDGSQGMHLNCLVPLERSEA